MFIGHWAPAMVAATRKNAPSLPVLFIAAQLVDWAFFLFLMFGVESMRVTPGISVMNPLDLYYMPYTHSLLGSAAWSAGFGVLVFAICRNRTSALIAAAVVLSHWFLDLLVHIPDLTIAGSEPKLGLGLWNHPGIEMPLELMLTFCALGLYVRAAKPNIFPTIVLGGALLMLQAINWSSAVETEGKTSTSILAFVAFGLITAISAWVNRSVKTSA